MRVTVSLTKVSCGTELNIVQEGIPEIIPVEMCYLGLSLVRGAARRR
jgi:hypothetical protein